jgi:carboxyl-terminal processing protease
MFLVPLATILLLVVGFYVGILYDEVFAQAPIPATGQGELNEGLIDQAYNLIQRYYVDREAVDSTELTYGAIAGMVDSLGDTGHSRFMTPEMLRQHTQSISGEFEGIGALVQEEDGVPVIVAPFDNSPAQKAGLKAGDAILAVNGEEVAGQPLSVVISKIVGKAGTDVTLTIQEADTGDTRDVTITRAKIDIPAVAWKMVPGTRIALIRLTQFSSGASAELVKAIQDARSVRAEAIILDLRNNPGGLLDEAVKVTSQFINKGYVLQQQDAEGNVEKVPVRRGGQALDVPMVVLINGGSASAAEIVSGALQDYDRATLVGETTFGTGTVLNQFGLPDGSALLLAVEQWLTPTGREIWHVGIQPDVQVTLPPDVVPVTPLTDDLSAQDLRNLEDTQLLKAIELLSKK